jgi:hypothetical protein
MNKSTLILFVTIAVFSFLQIDCKKEPPIVPPVNNPLQLTVEDATCTEVFINLSLPANEQNRTVTLKRGDSTIATIVMANNDTLFVDEGLLPKKTYTYTLVKDSRNVSAQATTMDTTSHDWTWQVDTLGIGDSYLYDVAIINDTLAYAVGEIYIKDSMGQFDHNAYNVARWNGKSWKLMRIQFYTICGQQSRTSYPSRAIFANGQSDIWIASGGSQIAHWDGTSEPTITCLPVSFAINKIWASNSNDVYIVGNDGIILHYNGNTWQKLESGTTVTLNDAWGGSNKWIGENVLLVVVGEKYTSSETKILKLSNQKVDSIPWQSLIRTRQSIWFGKERSLYSCGSGVFRYANGAWKHFSEIPAIYTNLIRGNASNDLLVVGDFGIVGHFNGTTWKVYDELKLPNGNYESVAIKGNIAIAAGWYNARGYVAVGKR